MNAEELLQMLTEDEFGLLEPSVKAPAPTPEDRLVGAYEEILSSPVSTDAHRRRTPPTSPSSSSLCDLKPCAQTTTSASSWNLLTSWGC